MVCHKIKFAFNKAAFVNKNLLNAFLKHGFSSELPFSFRVKWKAVRFKKEKELEVKLPLSFLFL